MLFRSNLFEKPQILVATKMDDPQSTVNLKKVKLAMKEMNPSLFAISSVTGEGIEQLLWKIKEGLAIGREEDSDGDLMR